jgi:hypothetical protein
MVTTNQKVNFIPVKPCPICGAGPQRIKESLSRPGGRGYPGYFTYQYRCECCKLLKSEELSDLYEKEEAVIEKAKVSWNQKVEEVQAYLNNKWVSKTLVENNVI